MPNKNLPIWALANEILSTLAAESRIALMAPTGSGKTTQVPQMLACPESPCADGKIFILEPRRVAARNVALRVALEMDTTPGKLVGYQVRFDDQTSSDSKIIFMTEGLFLRRIAANPDLKGVSCVIFDEFHERNIGSDTALALIKRLQENERPDLKTVIMSATLEAERVADYLGKIKCLKSEGRQYPVDIHYLDYMNQSSFPPEIAAETALQISEQNDPGDILIFMPGKGEIQQTLRELKNRKFKEPVNLVPLHGELPAAEQDQAFQSSETRKIVVSTNVAETSVTIEGITHVIDSGLARVARYCPEKGINILELQPISRASADQRAGRAGRTGPGTCHRLWTESSHLNRPAKTIPEILRADFSDTLLLLKNLDIHDISKLEWLDSPSEEAFQRSRQLLIDLGALDLSEEIITEKGKLMQKLPVSPRLGRILVEASRSSCFIQAVLCVALISDREILLPLKKGKGVSDIIKRRKSLVEFESTDFLLAIRAFELAARNRFAVEICRQYGIHAQAARTTHQAFLKLVETCISIGLVKKNEVDINNVFQIPEPTLTELRRILFLGFPDYLAKRLDRGTLRCELSNGEKGEIAQDSIVHDAPLLFTAVLKQPGGTGLPLMSVNTQVDPAWLEEDHSSLITRSTECEYVTGVKRVESFSAVRYRELVIEKSRTSLIDPTKSARSLAQAALDKKYNLPEWNHQVEQRIARYNLVALSVPDLEMSVIDVEAKIKILEFAFHGLTLAKEAQKIQIVPFLMKWISSEKWEWIEELAPARMRLFDQKAVKLSYFDPLESKSNQMPPPIIQIPILDCFNLEANPTVLDGKIMVMMRLLAPDGKKIADTQDWKSFKIKEYPMKRGALRNKYPGKFWP